jgi:5-hydroxyisourate hydrolase
LRKDDTFCFVGGAMSGISTHVLDTGTGRPAAGVGVLLERWDSAWVHCGAGVTDGDGRCKELLGVVVRGRYRLTFQTGEYFGRDGGHTFFPEVGITFQVVEDGGKYHVPLLVSGFGYTTYRGS